MTDALTVVPMPRTSEGTSAWDLVSAAQAGDHAAFGQLYDRYVDVVFKFVLFRVGDRPLAEDLTSETFARALRRIDSVSYQGRDVGAWFVTIARNLVYDHNKCHRTRLEVSTDQIHDAGHTPGTDEQVISRDVSRVVWRCIGRLSREQRDAVMLVRICGLGPKEAAESLGVDCGALKSRVHRGEGRLAQMPELLALVG